MKWRTVAVGKPALAYAKAGVEEYASRLRHYGESEIAWIKEAASPAETTRRILDQARDARPVLLDERGREHTTRSLLAEVEAWEAGGVKRVAVIVGGADGHPPELRKSVPDSWALGRLTLQHELALLVWMEQLYRLQTLRRGEAYHRD